jgi:hypothetical protein
MTSSDSRPLSTLIAQRDGALATLAHLADLHARSASWTEAERFEAAYSNERAARAYRLLDDAQASIAALTPAW